MRKKRLNEESPQDEIFAENANCRCPKMAVWCINHLLCVRARTRGNKYHQGPPTARANSGIGHEKERKKRVSMY